MFVCSWFLNQLVHVTACSLLCLINHGLCREWCRYWQWFQLHTSVSRLITVRSGSFSLNTGPFMICCLIILQFNVHTHNPLLAAIRSRQRLLACSATDSISSSVSSSRIQWIWRWTVIRPKSLTICPVVSEKSTRRIKPANHRDRHLPGRLPDAGSLSTAGSVIQEFVKTGETSL